jgi:hypothetical protein
MTTPQRTSANQSGVPVTASAPPPVAPKQPQPVPVVLVQQNNKLWLDLLKTVIIGILVSVVSGILLTRYQALVQQGVWKDLVSLYGQKRAARVEEEAARLASANNRASGSSQTPNPLNIMEE